MLNCASQRKKQRRFTLRSAACTRHVTFWWRFDDVNVQHITLILTSLLIVTIHGLSPASTTGTCPSTVAINTSLHSTCTVPTLLVQHMVWKWPLASHLWQFASCVLDSGHTHVGGVLPHWVDIPGLANPQGIYTIKCPHTHAKESMTPQAASASKNGFFCKSGPTGAIELRRNHNYFYQVHVTLAITKWFCLDTHSPLSWMGKLWFQVLGKQSSFGFTRWQSS